MIWLIVDYMGQLRKARRTEDFVRQTLRKSQLCFALFVVRVSNKRREDTSIFPAIYSFM